MPTQSTNSLPHLKSFKLPSLHIESKRYRLCCQHYLFIFHDIPNSLILHLLLVITKELSNKLITTLIDEHSVFNCCNTISFCSSLCVLFKFLNCHINTKSFICELYNNTVIFLIF
eukprot:85532_1